MTLELRYDLGPFNDAVYGRAFSIVDTLRFVIGTLEAWNRKDLSPLKRIGLVLDDVRRAYTVSVVVTGLVEIVIPTGAPPLEVEKMPNDQLKYRPAKRGDAPLGPDGQPVELHHPDQNEPYKVRETSQEEHRIGENFKKNHPNTGQEDSKIDRDEFKKQKKAWWQSQWDQGRFDKLPPPPAKSKDE